MDGTDGYNFPQNPFRRPLAWGPGLLLLGLVAALGVVLGHIAPILYDESVELLKLAPRALGALRERSVPIQEILVAQGLFTRASIAGFFKDFDFFDQALGQARLAIQQLWLTTPTLLGGVVNILLIPILSFFLLKDLAQLQKE